MNIYSTYSILKLDSIFFNESVQESLNNNLKINFILNSDSI